MGVKNLWDILESCKKTFPLHHLQNKRVCIDLSCWMVQFQNVNKSHSALADKLHLRGLFHRLRALIALNCSLIFVTDGAIPAIKLSTYRRRLNLGFEPIQDETNSQKRPSSLRRNEGSDFSRMIKDAKLLGLALGIPCLDGIEEGEAQCALLNSESQCDGCFTTDSDAFLFGARTVYRDICLGEGGYVVCYEMADIQRKLGFGRNSLIALAIILGSDYFPGVHGLGPESACQIVKTVGNDAILHKIATEGLLIGKKKNKSKRQEDSSNLICNNNKENESSINGPGKEQLEKVINAYMKPKCHTAESKAVQRVLVSFPFQRAKLQAICFNFFEWPSEKTDEYILPKIAERDLRKFANLRSTSTEQGVQLPLHKMPVKCPVSAIIKRRIVQGIECFEVSWEQRDDGLKTSIVPADLLESACPEKILEFVESRALGKKQKPKQQREKKSDKVAHEDVVDLQLKNLVLEIERDSETIQTSTFARFPIGTMQIRRPLADMTNNKITFGSSPSKPTIKKDSSYVDIIDLCSSPEGQVARPCVSKHERAKVEVIELIDSSESESEALSPEHAKKARDLRLFLGNICVS
ncbi:single-strand DNA endonuclease 1 [Impatiens glandulifera]|uniref:single-strand DNA endonuclease 1 n=1 Tax=Impatiens glandulifera TaxID=253017 RepID=UPI001FB14C7F|nr:single-strand DNA endonuclease 1 [Impatiens glandulifera]